MTVKQILDIVPMTQALALLEDSARTIKKKRKTAKDFAKLGVKNIVGTEFIRLESGLIASI